MAWSVCIQSDDTIQKYFSAKPIVIKRTIDIEASYFGSTRHDKIGTIYEQTTHKIYPKKIIIKNSDNKVIKIIILSNDLINVFVHHLDKQTYIKINHSKIYIRALNEFKNSPMEICRIKFSIPFFSLFS